MNHPSRTGKKSRPVTPVPQPVTRAFTWAFTWERCLLAFALLLPVAAFPQPRLPHAVRVLRVTGTGDAVLPVSVALLRLQLQARGKTAAEAQGELRRKTGEVVAILKSGGAAAVDMDSRRLGTGSEGSKISSTDGQEFVASVRLECRSAVDLAGALADAATRNRLAHFAGVEFLPSDEELRQAKQAAWKMAVADAKTQAGTVLAALGLKTEEVISVRMRHETDSLAGKGGQGQSIVRATIELEIRY